MEYCLQLDLYEKHQSTNTDADTYRKIVEKERIDNFLLGLDPFYEAPRGRIITKRPLPLLREVFAEVQWEESRR